jgi:hypothetical protein
MPGKDHLLDTLVRGDNILWYFEPTIIIHISLFSTILVAVILLAGFADVL